MDFNPQRFKISVAILLWLWALASCVTPSIQSNEIALLPPSPTKTVSTLTQTRDPNQPVLIPHAIPGMAWDGQFLWQLVARSTAIDGNNAPARLLKMTLTGEIVQTTQVSQDVPTHKSLVWGQGRLWMLDFGNRLYQIDPQTGTMLSVLPLLQLSSTDKAEQLTWNGNDLWLLQKNYTSSDNKAIPPRFYRLQPQSGAVLEMFAINVPGFEALFENLANDGTYFYIAKSSLLTQERNQLFRIHMQTHQLEKRPLGRVFFSLPTLFIKDNVLQMMEVLDQFSCPKGCRATFYPTRFEDRGRAPRLVVLDAPQGCQQPPPGGSPMGPPPGSAPGAGKGPGLLESGGPHRDCMSGGGPPPGGSPPGNNSGPPPGPPKQGPGALTLGNFVLSVNQSFKVQAVIDAQHQALVERERLEFEGAMERGELQEYYRVPSFAILMAAGSEGSFLNPNGGNQLAAGSEGSFLNPNGGNQLAAGSEGSFLNPNQGGSQLAAGSEGSYFDAAENQDKLPSGQAAFAKALVIADGKTAQIYKGQFEQGRFYFQGMLHVAENNVTYLMTLDQSLKTQIFRGKMRTNPGLTPKTTVRSSSPPPPLPPEQKLRFQKALETSTQESAAFQKLIGQGIFSSNSINLPPSLRSPVLLKLIEAFPEVASDVFELLDLTPVPLDNRSQALREHYKEKYPQFFVNVPADDPFINPQRGTQRFAGPPPPANASAAPR